MSIPGHFHFKDIYKKAINTFSSSSEATIFVEVGVRLGESAAYMANNKPSHTIFYVVDVWASNLPEDFKTHSTIDQYVLKHGRGFDYLAFLHAMKEAGCLSKMIPLKLDSVLASEFFEDESIDFLFIDADHTYEGMMGQLIAWYPKIKKNGVLAGDDYRDGVQKAVEETLGHNKIKRHGVGFWIHEPKMSEAWLVHRPAIIENAHAFHKKIQPPYPGLLDYPDINLRQYIIK